MLSGNMSETKDVSDFMPERPWRRSSSHDGPRLPVRMLRYANWHVRAEDCAAHKMYDDLAVALSGGHTIPVVEELLQLLVHIQIRETVE
jgi:hypothetical protein